jgi:hypothetical protein
MAPGHLLLPLGAAGALVFRRRNPDPRPALGVGERADDAPVDLLDRDASVGQGDVGLAAVKLDDQRRRRAASTPAARKAILARDSELRLVQGGNSPTASRRRASSFRKRRLG